MGKNIWNLQLILCIHLFTPKGNLKRGSYRRMKSATNRSGTRKRGILSWPTASADSAAWPTTAPLRWSSTACTAENTCASSMKPSTSRSNCSAHTRSSTYKLVLIKVFYNKNNFHHASYMHIIMSYVIMCYHHSIKTVD